MTTPSRPDRPGGPPPRPTDRIRRSLRGVARFLPGPQDLTAARRQPLRDLTAGLTVAVVALPLALGFGVASGMGAAAGLVSAVVAGTVAAVFGGSNLLVSGPGGPIAVVLAPIVLLHGPGGALAVGLLAGVLLLGLAVTGIGRYVQYIPVPVVEGFTAGIAGVIFLQQVPAALGVPTTGGGILPAAAHAVVTFGTAPHWPSLIISVGVAATILVGARLRPTVPFSLVAVGTASVVAATASLDVATIGALPSTLPAPDLGFLDPAAVPGLLEAAVAVAALVALESLLCATVADGMTVGQRHDPDRELLGQGLANIAAPMFGGIPASAAIARTAVNVRSGAGSRLAALTHAVVLALMMAAAAPLVSQVPLAALAGVLLATTVRMIEVGSLLALGRASRSDAALIVLTLGATLVLDLVTAVVLGLGIATVTSLGKIARTARLHQEPLDTSDHRAEERALLAEHIVAFRLDGPLFFAAAHRFLLELTNVADVRVVVLRMSHVSTVDATGAVVLRDAVEHLEHRHIEVHLSGVRPEHEQALAAGGVLERLRTAGRVHSSTEEAIRAGRAHLQHHGVIPGHAAPLAPDPV